MQAVLYEKGREKTMKTPDLKPCPFCGGKAVTETNNRGWWIVGCVDDYMCMGNINHIAMLHVTEEQAVETWNRRANDADAT
jgi:hypothetical protein